MTAAGAQHGCTRMTAAGAQHGCTRMTAAGAQQGCTRTLICFISLYCQPHIYFTTLSFDESVRNLFLALEKCVRVTLAAWARRVARNLVVQGSMLGSCNLPAVSLGQAELLAKYTHVQANSACYQLMANEYRAVVAVLVRWKQVVQKSLKRLIEPL